MSPDNNSNCNKNKIFFVYNSIFNVFSSFLLVIKFIEKYIKKLNSNRLTVAHYFLLFFVIVSAGIEEVSARVERIIKK